MNRTKIAIFDKSEILKQGLTAILKDKGALYEIHKHNKPECFFQSSLSDQIDIIILNPAIFLDNQGEKIKNISHIATRKNIKLVALVYAFFDQEILSLFDQVITINDSPSRILEKLRELFESPNKEESELDQEQLSSREQDVMRLIALGNSNKEIADILNLSIHTVVTHRKNITNKLGIKSTSGLTIYAIINKLISEEDSKKSIGLMS